MPVRQLRIMVVGTGSIGQRHIRLLRERDEVEVFAVEPAEEKRRDVQVRYGLAKVFKDIGQIRPGEIDGLIISSPPKYHVEQALAGLEYKVPILIEKPLGRDWSGVDRLIRESGKLGIPIGVAYNMRYLPALEKAKELLAEEGIGRILCGRVVCNINFAKGRPDYASIYFASKDLGGGVILDHSHELDYMQWLLGETQAVMCLRDHLSDMQIETEDVALLLLRLRSGALLDYHTNCFQKNRVRFIELVGSEGTIIADQEAVRTTKIKGSERVDFSWELPPDYTYRKQTENLLRVVEGNGSFRTPLPEASHTLRVCLAAMESAEKGELVNLDHFPHNI